MKEKVFSLAVGLSFVVGSFACSASTEVNYSDVTSQTQYAESIIRLSKLGIVEGFEDETFRTEKTLTRAEAAKLMVDILDSDEAAQRMRKNIAFDDVSKDHWAAGYIAIGTSRGYINGTGENKFEPEQEVTFAQMVKMLVHILGYGQDADKSGGWVTGYIMTGSRLGITEDVNAQIDLPVTRGQAVKLIDNALDIPLCVIVGYEMENSVDDNGEKVNVMVPVTEVYDGNGESGRYETLLTTYHN